MSRDVMGIQDEELIGGLESGGAASFLADALKSRVTLFV
jgi:peroxiredoxin family protein